MGGGVIRRPPSFCGALSHFSSIQCYRKYHSSAPAHHPCMYASIHTDTQTHMLPLSVHICMFTHRHVYRHTRSRFPFMYVFRRTGTHAPASLPCMFLYSCTHTDTHTPVSHPCIMYTCRHTDRDAPTSFYVYMYTPRHPDTRRHTYVCIHNDTQALAFLTCMYTHTHTHTHTLPFPFHMHVCVYTHRHTATHALASRSCKYIYPHRSIGKTLADKLVPMKKMDWRLKGWLKINVMLPLYFSYQRISGWKKNYNEYCWQERFKGPIRDFGKGGRG